MKLISKYLNESIEITERRYGASKLETINNKKLRDALNKLGFEDVDLVHDGYDWWLSAKDGSIAGAGLYGMQTDKFDEKDLKKWIEKISDKLEEIKYKK